MTMSEAELAARTRRLPAVFASRLPDGQLDVLQLMADGGEWDELLGILVAVLHRTQALVSADERDELRAVLTGWGLAVDELDGLVVRE